MQKGRVETIDVFRGIAILLVILFHFTARLPNYAINVSEGAPPPVFFGWVGVYFFFIISGYCIFMTLERSATVNLFLARRFSRIYPAFVAAVLGLFAFGMFFHIPSVPEANFHETAPSAVDVVLNLLFLGEIGEWVNGSFWSIAVEVKFYLLVGILAALFRNTATFTRIFAWLGIVMAPVWIASVPFSDLDGGPINPQSMLKFLLIAPYLCFFAVGILGRQIECGAKGLGPLFAVNFALSIAVVFVQEMPNGLVSAAVSAAVYLALALLFLRFVLGGAIPHLPVVSSAMAKIGVLSFSWYLVHENIGVSFLSTANLYLPAWASLLGTMAATLCIAVVFSALVEHRFRKPVEKVALAVLELPSRLFKPRQAATQAAE